MCLPFCVLNNKFLVPFAGFSERGWLLLFGALLLLQNEQGSSFKEITRELRCSLLLSVNVFRHLGLFGCSWMSPESPDTRLYLTSVFTWNHERLKK